MCRKNINLFSLCCLILAVITAVHSGAQTEWPAGIEPWPEFPDTADLELIVPADSATGWLILDGRLINAPYTIITNDSTILVNGIDVRGERKPPPSKISPERLAEAEAGKTMMDNYWIDLEKWGKEEARRRALDYILRQPVVDTAYLGEKAIAVVFKDARSAFHYGLERVIVNGGLSPLRPRHLLNAHARTLGGYLTNGSLFIHERMGHYQVYGDWESKDILQRIQTAVETTSDIEELTKALKAIIGSTSMAERIAEQYIVPNK